MARGVREPSKTCGPTESCSLGVSVCYVTIVAEQRDNNNNNGHESQHSSRREATVANEHSAGVASSFWECLAPREPLRIAQIQTDKHKPDPVRGAAAAAAAVVLAMIGLPAISGQSHVVALRACRFASFLFGSNRTRSIKFVCGFEGSVRPSVCLRVCLSGDLQSSSS